MEQRDSILPLHSRREWWYYGKCSIIAFSLHFLCSFVFCLLTQLKKIPPLPSRKKTNLLCGFRVIKSPVWFSLAYCPFLPSSLGGRGSRNFLLSAEPLKSIPTNRQHCRTTLASSVQRISASISFNPFFCERFLHQALPLSLNKKKCI